MILILVFLFLLFIQGKLVWETQEKPPMSMPREVAPRIEQHVDSLNHIKEIDSLLF